jgi:hypothetical protein
LLAQIDADAFQVTGVGTSESHGTRLRVDVPKVDLLRRFIRGHGR